MNLGFWGQLKRPACADRPIMAMAPMSGVSDEAFRLMFLKYGKPDVFWTEFVSAEGLFSKGRDVCLKILDYSKDERPIVAQIFGADLECFEKTAKLVEELGFDGIDINMGCPDSNVEARGGGASLIKNPELAKKIIRAVKGATSLPVSVKTRIGYNKNELAEWILAILEEEPAVLTVHFRTKKEMYFGPAHWELAEEIVKLRDKISKKTLILGNGDVKTLEQAKQLAKDNNLDGIMIGRALIGNPWLFAGKEPIVQERLDAALEHTELFLQMCGNNPRNFSDIKKHYHAYIKNFRGAKELRDALMAVKTADEVKKLIENFKNLNI